MEREMKWLNIATLLLLIVGGINWGVVAMGGYEADLVANLFGGSDTAGARLIYTLVGLSALWQLIPFFKSFRVGEVDAEANLSRRATTR
jgi:uncharacterized membrane protein YuzA (DUF378 family)